MRKFFSSSGFGVCIGILLVGLVACAVSDWTGPTQNEVAALEVSLGDAQAKLKTQQEETAKAKAAAEAAVLAFEAAEKSAATAAEAEVAKAQAVKAQADVDMAAAVAAKNEAAAKVLAQAEVLIAAAKKPSTEDGGLVTASVQALAGLLPPPFNTLVGTIGSAAALLLWRRNASLKGSLKSVAVFLDRMHNQNPALGNSINDAWDKSADALTPEAANVFAVHSRT